MRATLFIIAFLFAATLANAETNSAPDKSGFQSVKTNAAQSWRDIKETLGASKDYTFEKKDEFVAKAKEDLSALDNKIAELRKKILATKGETKADSKDKLKKLKEQRDVLNKKLKEAKAASAENWEKAKAGFTNGYEQVKSSVKDAWQWVSDKVTN